MMAGMRKRERVPTSRFSSDMLTHASFRHGQQQCSTSAKTSSLLANHRSILSLKHRHQKRYQVWYTLWLWHRLSHHHHDKLERPAAADRCSHSSPLGLAVCLLQRMYSIFDSKIRSGPHEPTKQSFSLDKWSNWLFIFFDVIVVIVANRKLSLPSPFESDTWPKKPLEEIWRRYK